MKALIFFVWLGSLAVVLAVAFAAMWYVGDYDYGHQQDKAQTIGWVTMVVVTVLCITAMISIDSQEHRESKERERREESK